MTVRAFWQPRPHGVTMQPPDPSAASAEKKARDELQKIADQVSAVDLDSAENVKQLLVHAIDAVACAYYPNDGTAILNFTISEALLMSEDISQRLRDSIVKDIPTLGKLSIKYAIKGQEVIKPAKHIWNTWRVIRLYNPVTALIQEARSFILNKGLDMLFRAARTRIAAILVREVGEVAIGLYSGAYRRRAEELSTTAPTPVKKPIGPLTILIAGQVNAGKSSLLNALLGVQKAPVGLTRPSEKFIAYELQHEQAGALILVDSPGISSAPSKKWLDQAREADLVFWVTAANHADHAAEQRVLTALLAPTDDRQRLIPSVLVVTHADKLNPPLEWAPPYNLTGDRPKEKNMRAALEAAGKALKFPVHRQVLVAVANESDGVWNLENLWPIVHDILPEAKQKQIERGSRPDGWLQATYDVVISVPGVFGFAIREFFQ